MTHDDAAGLTRRSLLSALGLGMASTGFPFEARGATSRSVHLPREGAGLGAASDPRMPAVSGLHLQFGSDAATEITVSWQADAKVAAPRVLFGRDGEPHERTVPAETVSYRDGKTGKTVFAHHARLTGLRPDTAYVYLAVHDGAQPEHGTFRTAPRGRAAFTFTSFGDQGTPTAAKRFVPPPGGPLRFPVYVNDNLGSPAAADVTAGVERVAPLLHLINGDLCYGNLSEDPVRAWSDFWNNNGRSARHRPWMPCPGNHENEQGNGPLGFRAYQTYFGLPRAPGQTDDTAGLWYAFTVAAVRFISLSNDDICYQDGGGSYIRGYSRGAQKAWLEAELKAARRDPGIDWIVVCMHQTAVSTADKFNGADLGIREEWLPLFDAYGVDLVVCGHEHHYERSHPLRGHEENRTLTPIPREKNTAQVDTSRGTVHLVLGGGGTSAPSNGLLMSPPRCRIITAVGEPDPKTGKRPPVYVMEDAPWSASRDAEHAYGFAAFSVDPGDRPGGTTSMRVTYFNVSGPYGSLQPFEQFTLQRRRSDPPAGHAG